MADQLLAREPLFWRRNLVSTQEEFRREADPGYVQVGVSGVRYTRDDVWKMTAPYISDPGYVQAGVGQVSVDQWKISDVQVTPVAADMYLFTYQLEMPERPTACRTTLWQGSAATGWKALYHQATPVLADPYALPPQHAEP